MKNNWFIYSVLSLFLFSVMSYIIIAVTKKGYPVTFVLFGLSIVVTVSYFLQTFVFSPQTYSISPGLILLLVIGGVLSTFANYLMYQAANDAPNAGLALAIGGQQAALVAILAFFILKDRLNILQILGIILAASAIVLINIGSAPKESSKKPAVQKGSVR